jgi:prophage antirepressor-like protein
LINIDNTLIQTTKIENNSTIYIDFIEYDNIKVHIICIDNEYWLRAGDICKLLDYDHVRNALSHIFDENKISLKIILDTGFGQKSPEQFQSDTLIKLEKLKSLNSKTIYINKSGLYELCLGSKKPKALEFRKWVVNDVIPNIEKTGSYTLQKNTLMPLQCLNKFIFDINRHKNNKCVYILKIKNNFYKFGRTGDPEKRTNTHERNLQFESVLAMVNLQSTDECIWLERSIDTFCKTSHIKCDAMRQKILLGDLYKSHSREMFETTNQITIQDVLDRFYEYLTNVQSDRQTQLLLNGNCMTGDPMLDNPDIPIDVKIKRLEIEKDIKIQANNAQKDYNLKKLEMYLTHNISPENIDKYEQYFKKIQEPQYIKPPTLQIQKSIDTNDYSNNNDSDDYDYDNESQIECQESSVENLPTKTIPMINLPMFPPKSPTKNKQIEKPPTKINKIQSEKTMTTEKEDEPIDILTEIDEYFEEIDIDEPTKVPPKPKQIEKKPTKKTITKKTTTKQTIKKAEVNPIEKVEMPRSKFAVLQNIHKPKKQQKETERTNECCTICGNPLTAFRNRCDHCPSLKRFQDAIERGNRPSFITLKKDLEAMSMVAVGKKYGVSDNCIKKWLNKYIKYDLVNT